jgi:hypothetical protein
MSNARRQRTKDIDVARWGGLAGMFSIYEELS